MSESHNNSNDAKKLDPSETSHNEQPSNDTESIKPVTTAYRRSKAKTNKSALIKKAILALLVLIVLSVITYGLFKSNQHSEPDLITLQGQMQMQQTSIGAKVPGRIVQILVTEGDSVEIGQQLIEMDSPEINTKINQARADKELAQS